MKRRYNTRILAKRLLREKKAAGSWRALQKQKYPTIPAGTLCRIATSLGDYIPRRLDFREALGLSSLPCPSCHRPIKYPHMRNWYHLYNLTDAELRYVFEHREVMA